VGPAAKFYPPFVYCLSTINCRYYLSKITFYISSSFYKEGNNG
jgi:hypothetical protein